MKQKEYTDFAMSLGAKHSLAISLDQIVFDYRTYLKCMFGCDGSIHGSLCHSQQGRIKPWEYEPILRRYCWGILIHSNANRIAQQISLELERKAFIDGYYFAFSFSDCSICKDCSRVHGSACPRPLDVRPSMHSIGIDVFKTVHGMGLPLRTLKEYGEERNCYSLVLVE